MTPPSEPPIIEDPTLLEVDVTDPPVIALATHHTPDSDVPLDNTIPSVTQAINLNLTRHHPRRVGVQCKPPQRVGVQCEPPQRQDDGGIP
jgi:hypothetical protein